MPTYEYHCKRCGHRFSQFQRITEPPVKKCPKCGKNGGVERLISGGSGLIFKGSGFYITDYARKSETGKKSDKSGPETSGKKEEKKD
ncbi:MAG: zinc ribbon domain-containing protein [candidate division WOR-3 bacterium]|mgnify:CR=1 FL=1|uniref:Zinc ribbon domain-containing protein n=1 Tax=candidate division WOR-3 bacterium TaxID=2052148 RepID=A0A7C3EHZ3_UNCW3|nr:zinc ribbon domain-containing protein [candidate division WOR-3 bacterium]